jgi:hypothetical protein
MANQGGVDGRVSLFLEFLTVLSDRFGISFRIISFAKLLSLRQFHFLNVQTQLSISYNQLD